MRRRWVILALGLPVYAFVLALIATVLGAALVQPDWSDYRWSGFPGEVAGAFGEGEWWGFVGIPTLVVVASQVVFLVPIFSRRPPRGERSRSLKVSLGIGGAVAALLTLGLVLAVCEALSELANAQWLEDIYVQSTMLVLLLASWCFWSALLILFTREIWADRLLGRLVGLLVAGTLLELLVVVPLDIMVRRRSDCYCWSGTFFALCLAVTAVLWMAGPGVVIALCSRRHRMWRETHCPRCGYPRGPSPGAACPECGEAWATPASPTTPSGDVAKGDRRDSNP